MPNTKAESALPCSPTSGHRPSLPQVAAADPLLCKGISSRQLQVVPSGSALPVIDLSQASAEAGGGGMAKKASPSCTSMRWADVGA